MIENKKDYKNYLTADAKANGKKRKFCIPWWDIVWKQLKLLRKYEYHLNCYRKGIFRKIILGYDKIKYKKISVLTGLSIPPNTFGKGLTIYHHGCVIVNSGCRGGDYVTLQMGVNIAADTVIGNNVYIAPGVKIAAHVIIPDNCIIGYNTVVTRSLKDVGTYVGAPAKKISDNYYPTRFC